MPTHRADSRASIEGIWGKEGESLERACFVPPQFPTTDLQEELADEARRRESTGSGGRVYGPNAVDANGNSLAGKPIEPEVWHAG